LLQAIGKFRCGVNVDATMVLGVHLFSNMSTSSIEVYRIPNTEVIAPLPHDLMQVKVAFLLLRVGFLILFFPHV
jgi:hypothetical protein